MKQNKTYIIGITGGVGSGKSTVLEYIEAEYKAFVIQADQVAHQQMQPGTACYNEIIDAFGTDICIADGTIDRKALGNIVFNKPEQLATLNQIVHPAVKTEIGRMITEQQGRLILVEAALLIEEHYEQICDELWYIHASDRVRRSRLAQSRGYTDEKTDSIMANQLSEEEFRRHCQVVIDNSNEWNETEKQIRRAVTRGGQTWH